MQPTTGCLESMEVEKRRCKNIDVSLRYSDVVMKN